MIIKNHWSVNMKEIKKDPEALAIWFLEQRINYGIGDDKINKINLLKYWDKINIDIFKRKALLLAI